MGAVPVSLPSTTMTTDSSAKPRLPSLNQLAARINPPPANNNSLPAAPRPRLAAFALRTGPGSSSSIATNDSIAVNAASSTRSTPPSISPTPSSNAGSVENGGESLTSDKLDKLNQETIAPPEKKNVKVGYKNIPSLDAITARMAKTRTLSIDGTPKPPEPEMIEDPKTPGVHMKPPEHPLQFTWTVYHDTKSKFPYTPVPPSAIADPSFTIHPPESTDYEAGLTVIGEFNTVEEFCRYFNWLKPPSKLERNSNYHLFKSGIKPMWEDEANANGGKWVLTMKNSPALLDRCWSWLAMALVGEELEEGDEICGAVVSLRSKVDRIQVWTRSKDDVEKLNAIGKRLVKLLDISEADNIGLEFQYNTDDRPLPNKFLSIQSLPTSSFRSTFQSGGAGPPSAGAGPPGAAGGTFGNFAGGRGERQRTQR